MKRDEYIETLVVGKHLVVLGLDDAGQTYFFEYVDENGNLKEECCGPYNFNYREYLEYKFCDPETDCKYYDMMSSNLGEEHDCPNKNIYGYCDKCKYQNLEWSYFQELINNGIIDRRGNVNKKYKKFLKPNLNDENSYDGEDK